MKKLVSLILAIIMLCACVVSASAYSPFPEDSEEYKHLREIEAQHLPLLAEYVAQNSDGASVNKLKILYQGKIDGEQYYVFSFDSDDRIEKEFFYRMGMYAVRAQYEFPVFADGYAVYTVADNQWHPLTYLYDKDKYGFEMVAYLQIYGDSGINDFCYITYFASLGPVTISAATEIQKHLAGMGFVEEKKVQYLDIDNDGTVTIKDATTLQKFIAGLDVYIHDSVV